MKFKIFAIILLAFTADMHSQTIYRYGIKIGLLSSSMKNEITNSTYNNLYKESRLGSNWGVFLTMFNSKYFNAEVEINYSQEGSEDKIAITTMEQPEGTGEYLLWDHEYDFLNARIMLHPKYDNESIVLYGIVGPVIKYLVQQRDEIGIIVDKKDIYLGYCLGIGVNPKTILNGKTFLEISWNGPYAYQIKNNLGQLKTSSLQFNMGVYIN